MAFDAGNVISYLILNTDKFKQGITDASADVKKFSESSDKMGGKLTTAGNVMTSVGKKATLGLTVPIVGAGAAVVKTASDFDSEMSKVQAITGASGDEMKKLEKKAREMGASTKFSASESAQALTYMGMAGWDTEQMTKGLPGVMDLAAASGEDLAMVSDIVTDSISGFGLTADDTTDYVDLLAKTATSSNTNVAMMGETFKYVAPLFGALGYSAEDAALATGLMANAGIKGSQAGTSLRMAVSKLIEPSETGAIWMKKLGINTTDASGKMLPFKDVLVQLREKFSGLSEEQQAQAASALFGKEAMSGMLAVINASDEEFDDLAEATQNYSGTAREMADVMEDNLKGEITKLLSALQELAISLGKVVIPYLRKFVQWIQKWVDRLNNSSEATKKTVVAIAGIAAAIGPVLSVGGTLLKGISAVKGVLGILTPVLGAATSGTVAMGKGVALAGAAAGKGALLLNPWTAALAAGAVGAVKLTKKLKEDAVPAVDLFGDEVSDGTKKAVGGFLDLEEKASNSLTKLVTTANKNADDYKNLTTQVNEDVGAMKDQVIGKLEEQKNQSRQIVEEKVKGLKEITAEEKEHMIKQEEEKIESQKKIVEEGSKRIQEITEEASKKKRDVTKEEQAEIDKIMKEMTETGVKVLSKGEKEQLAILERLKTESGKISAQKGAKIVKESKKQRDKTVKIAENEYKERLASAAELRAKGGKENEKLADKISKEAEKAYKESTDKANKTHDNVVSRAKSQAEEHAKHVDWETGEVKSKWRVLVDYLKGNDAEGKVKTKKDNGVNEAKTEWKGLRHWFKNNAITRWIKTKSDKPGKNYRGTQNWRGGLTWVGEQGPELVNLPKGSQVFSNQKSQQIAAGGGGKTQIVIENMSVRDDLDIVLISKELDHLREMSNMREGVRG